MSTEQLAACNKSDREKMLYAGAKAEGKVTWHTSLAGDSYKNLAAAYEARYPGVSPESYRATRQAISARIVAESQAQRYIADATEKRLHQPFRQSRTVDDEIGAPGGAPFEVKGSKAQGQIRAP